MDELTAIAVEIFGEDRVHVTPNLALAIDRAIERAEADFDPTRAGVLVTGSVVTAGNARVLLRPGAVR